MPENLTSTKECFVYPGEYTPSPEIEALLQELKIPGKEPASQPPVNMNEFKDCFKIEVVVPGVKRENIFVYVHDNILSIMVMHKDPKELKKKLQIHEFDNECLERHILLPKNANTEFVSAEYRRGILSLHIPKTEQPSEINTKQIIVY